MIPGYTFHAKLVGGSSFLIETVDEEPAFERDIHYVEPEPIPVHDDDDDDWITGMAPAKQRSKQTAAQVPDTMEVDGNGEKDDEFDIEDELGRVMVEALLGPDEAAAMQDAADMLDADSDSDEDAEEEDVAAAGEHEDGEPEGPDEHDFRDRVRASTSSAQVLAANPGYVLTDSWKVLNPQQQQIGSLTCINGKCLKAECRLHKGPTGGKCAVYIDLQDNLQTAEAWALMWSIIGENGEMDFDAHKGLARTVARDRTAG